MTISTDEIDLDDDVDDEGPCRLYRERGRRRAGHPSPASSGRISATTRRRWRSSRSACWSRRMFNVIMAAQPQVPDRRALGEEDFGV